MKKLISPLIIFFFLVLILVLNFVKAETSVSYSVEARVTVNPIYVLEIEINIIDKFVLLGENLSVLVNLSKEDLTNIKEKIEVDLNYEIWKLKREKIVSGYAGSINVSNETKKIIKIQIPSDIKPSKYTLKIKASNAQAYGDEDEDSFTVRKRLKITQTISLYSIFFFLNTVVYKSFYTLSFYKIHEN